MSSEKRDLSDLLKYEGEIVKGKNLYEFPTIYGQTKTGKIRSWNIFVRLIKKSKNPNKDIDWNLLEDDQLPIKESYISGKKELPPNSVGQYWIKSGETTGKKTRHPPSYGKAVNVGRANERNSLQTAIIRARNEYLKKVDHGFTKNIKELTDAKIKKKTMRFFPMLPTKYIEKYTKIEYPCYVQPKLDGARTVAFLHEIKNKRNGDVVLYTRELKDVPGKKKIREQLKPILDEMYDSDEGESVYIDFEFYKFGKKLQDISSDFRNEKGAQDIQCWIFDAFYPSELPEVPFDERFELVNEIFDVDNHKITYLTFKFDKKAALNNYKDWLDSLEKEYNHASEKEKKDMFKKTKGVPSVDYAKDLYENLKKLDTSKLDEFKVEVKGLLVKVPTLLASNRVEDEYFYRGFLELGFEGTIVRNTEGLYRADIKKTSYLRSPDVQKRKALFSDEYEIEGYEQGKRGRDKGAILFQFLTKQENLEDRKMFTVTPKGVTVKERKELYEKFIKDPKLFENEYKGLKMTIIFDDLSKDLVPLRAKSLGIRPYM